MTNELATRNSAELMPAEQHSSIGARHVLTPRTVDEAMDMAKLFHASRMYQVADVAQAFVVLTTGMELGLTASQAFRSIHVIKGKPTLSADLMVGLCKSQSCCKAFQLLESTEERAVYRTQRRGEEPVTMSFTIEQAKAAGLLSNDNWRKFPAAMLRARAASALARAVYPDLLMGMYTDEEAEAIDITPRPAPAQQAIAAPVHAGPAVEAPDANLTPAEKAERVALKKAILALAATAPPEREKEILVEVERKYGKPVKSLFLAEARECKAELEATLTEAQGDNAFHETVTAKAGVPSDRAEGEGYVSEKASPDDEDSDPFA